jgi:hypothetical protein
MQPPDTEDEFTFARRRAMEGAKRGPLVAELRGRGVNADLAESVVNGVMAQLPRSFGSRFGWLELISGLALLAAGAGLFYVRATQAFDGASIGFRLPTGIMIVGTLLVARGLFR